jgi:hypothetical protein
MRILNNSQRIELAAAKCLTSFSELAMLRRTQAPLTSDPVKTFNGSTFYNLCYTGFPRQELTAADLDYRAVRDRAINFNGKDGVKPMTKEEQEIEHQLTWNFAKEFTTSLFSADISGMSCPIGYCENRTFIERSADLFSFLATQYIDSAIGAETHTEQLGWITTGILAGFHLLLLSKKPWNPALGETFVSRWPNGPSFYAEQISHHPPISAVQVRGRGWKIDASLLPNIDQGLSKVDIFQKGTICLRIDNGSVYEWEYPTVRIMGIVRGDRIVKIHGGLRVRDLTNSLEAHIEIEPKECKRNGLKRCRATTVFGGIYSTKNPKAGPLAKLTGDYADRLFLDGSEVWDIARDFTYRPLEHVDDIDLLPSDGRFRIDRSYLIQGHAEHAGAAKSLFEDLQRREAKLRNPPSRGQRTAQTSL